MVGGGVDRCYPVETSRETTGDVDTENSVNGGIVETLEEREVLGICGSGLVQS